MQLRVGLHNQSSQIRPLPLGRFLLRFEHSTKSAVELVAFSWLLHIHSFNPELKRANHPSTSGLSRAIKGRRVQRMWQ